MLSIILRRRVSLICVFRAASPLLRNTPLSCISATANPMISAKSQLATVCTFTAGRFTCSACKGRFNDVGDLKAHIQSAHGALRDYALAEHYVCKCGCCFYDKDEFEKHKSDCHYIKFQLPPKGWVKLNTDGRCEHVGSGIPGKGKSGVGGFITDSEGVSALQFCEPIGISSSIEAETWALYRGLDIILQKGLHKNVVVEIDSESLLQDLRGRYAEETKVRGYNSLQKFVCDPKKSPKENLLLKVISILMDPTIEFHMHHILSKVNKVAHALAKKSLECNEFLVGDLSETDTKIKNLLLGIKEKKD